MIADKRREQIVAATASKTSIEALCAAKGMRMTEQRRIVARVLADSADHPDVEELYRRCHEIDKNISISTVYRTVKLFEDAGIIERHDFREGRARYEQIPESHHDHLINLRTGQVIEFTSEEIEKLQAEVARKLGYKLVDHRLELYAVPLDDKPRGDRHNLGSSVMAARPRQRVRDAPCQPKRDARDMDERSDAVLRTAGCPGMTVQELMT